MVQRGASLNRPGTIADGLVDQKGALSLFFCWVFQEEYASTILEAVDFQGQSPKKRDSLPQTFPTDKGELSRFFWGVYGQLDFTVLVGVGFLGGVPEKDHTTSPSLSSFQGGPPSFFRHSCFQG